MLVTLQITYFTRWGENLIVKTSEGTVQMRYDGNGVWIASFDSPEDLSYNYCVVADDATERTEWGEPRKLSGGGLESLHVFDRWHDRPEDAPFYSSAFTGCFFKRPSGNSPKRRKFTLKVAAPTLEPESRLELCGSTVSLGNWRQEDSLTFDDSDYPYFQASVDLQDGTDIEFKLLVRDSSGNVEWEQGENRHVRVPYVLADGCEIEIEPLRDPRAHWKCAGVAIPVFSLRSEDDEGIGDFLDLKLMADWAKKTGQRIIQVLPVNDTTMSRTWRDSYPYNAISSFALNPAYIRVSAIGTIPESEGKAYREVLKVNQLSDTVEYENVVDMKAMMLRLMYDYYGKLHLESDAFREFFNRNRNWLRPYAAFCVLRDRFRTADMSVWEGYSQYSEDKVDELERSESKMMGYWYFIQYHADKQLKEARDYCRSLRVCLKGDIPIGISRTSVDAWQYPRLFNLDKSAGAPPDDFAVLGQNWGFPTYNWEEMSNDGFRWWKDRFGKMADYFDAYRIDHLLGFFRIWEMPVEVLHGLLGTFNASLPLTPEEMARDYGFCFDRTLHTQPFITDRSLDRMFGDLASEVKQRFLMPPADGLYSLRPEYDTQRKIALHFGHEYLSESERRLCVGLMNLLDDVLFIEDTRSEGKYHARIAPRSSAVYLSLSAEQKDAFDRLYEDFYYHRPVDFWKRQALWKLPPLIDSTGMLCCGEDLGMIPSCVPEVMAALKIFSLKVQRMSGEYGEEFANPSKYPYYSVCTTSTHDMSGIRGWWEEDIHRAGRYFRGMLGGKGEAPAQAPDWVCDDIVKSHLDSESMLCILPLQDWLSIDGNIRRDKASDEQINDPSNPDNNWNYRMHINLERLNQAQTFNERLRWLVSRSGRG